VIPGHWSGEFKVDYILSISNVQQPNQIFYWGCHCLLNVPLCLFVSTEHLILKMLWFTCHFLILHDVPLWDECIPLGRSKLMQLPGVEGKYVKKAFFSIYSRWMCRESDYYMSPAKCCVTIFICFVLYYCSCTRMQSSWLSTAFFLITYPSFWWRTFRFFTSKETG